VPTLLMREVAASQGLEEWGLLRGALRRAGQFVTLASGSVTMIALLILWGIGDRLSSAMFCTMALMLLVLPLSAGTKTVARALMGLHRVVLGQAVDMLLRPLLVLALVGGAFLLWPELRQPQYAMAAQLLGAAVVLIAGLVILRRLTPREARTAPPAYRNREWLRSTLPFTLIGGALVLNSQTDIIMLGWFAQLKDVGIYRVAAQGSTLVAFSLAVASGVVAPQFSQLYVKGDVARLQYLVIKSSSVILFVATPMALVLLLGGSMLITWVFGSEYAPAYMPLAILVIGQLVLSVFGISGPLLSMAGYESTISKAIWVSALTNAILNLFFVPAFGAVGAAISTMLTTVGWSIYLFWLARDRLGINAFPFQ